VPIALQENPTRYRDERLEILNRPPCRQPENVPR